MNEIEIKIAAKRLAISDPTGFNYTFCPMNIDFELGDECYECPISSDSKECIKLTRKCWEKFFKKVLKEKK